MYTIDGSLRRSIGDAAEVIAQVTIMRSMLDLALIKVINTSTECSGNK